MCIENTRKFIDSEEESSPFFEVYKDLELHLSGYMVKWDKFTEHCLHEALKDEKWTEVVKQEFQSIEKNHTRNLRWVFKVKEGPNYHVKELQIFFI